MMSKIEYINELLATEAQQLQIEHQRMLMALDIDAQRKAQARSEENFFLRAKIRTLMTEFKDEISQCPALVKQMERFVEPNVEIDLQEVWLRAEVVCVQLELWMAATWEDVAKKKYLPEVEINLQKTLDSMTLRNAVELMNKFSLWMEEVNNKRYVDGFLILDNGVVRDPVAGLEWTRFALGQGWENEAPIGKAKTYKFDEAILASQEFNNKGGWGGHKDWRVPTIRELHKLLKLWGGRFTSERDLKGGQGTLLHIVEGSQRSPLVDCVLFPDMAVEGYQLRFWSSSTFVDVPNRSAWYIGFGHGYVNFDERTKNYAVRLVRSFL